MRIMAACVGFGLLWSSLPTHSCAAALPPDLEKAARQYDRAQMEGSRGGLEKILARDYQLANGRGQLESREQFIEEFATPGSRIDPYVVQQPIEIVWTNGAVLGGIVHLTGMVGGKAFDAHLRFADIWAKRAKRWQVVFTQVTQVPGQK
jgi:hypothetical protein